MLNSDLNPKISFISVNGNCDVSTSETLVISDLIDDVPNVSISVKEVASEIEIMQTKSQSKSESLTESTSESVIDVVEKVFVNVETVVKTGDLSNNSERHLYSNFDNTSNLIAEHNTAIDDKLNYPSINDDLSKPTNQIKTDDSLNIKSSKNIVRNGSKTPGDQDETDHIGEKGPEGNTLRGNSSLNLINQDSPNNIPETLDSIKIGCSTSTNSQIRGKNGHQNTSNKLPSICKSPKNALDIPRTIESIKKVPEKTV